MIRNDSLFHVGNLWRELVYFRQTEKMIPCTFNKLRIAETSSTCTSSWVDQAFYLWLFKENRQPLSHLSQRQRVVFLVSSCPPIIFVHRVRRLCFPSSQR